MTDEFSNFKSAIIWPNDRESEEAPTREFQPLGIAMLQAVEVAAVGMTMDTESPIETIFGARFALALKQLCKELNWEFAIAPELADVVLQPQYPLYRFRYDFAVKAKGRLNPLILIECDGRDFHSSVEQQTNDKMKNLAAANAGITLVRFSGSAINRDVGGCIRHAMFAFLRAALE
jgi:very-short-patch-repair endonuclease